MASETLKVVRLVIVNISHASHMYWDTLLTKYGNASTHTYLFMKVCSVRFSHSKDTDS